MAFRIISDYDQKQFGPAFGTLAEVVAYAKKNLDRSRESYRLEDDDDCEASLDDLMEVWARGERPNDLESF